MARTVVLAVERKNNGALVSLLATTDKGWLLATKPVEQKTRYTSTSDRERAAIWCRTLLYGLNNNEAVETARNSALVQELVG